MKQRDTVVVRFKIKNSGSRAGTEVCQPYLRDLESRLDRPDKELKAFSRVTLQPGQSEMVSLSLDKDAMSFFDPIKDDWVAEAGAFEVLVGASSRDIRLMGEFRLVD